MRPATSALRCLVVLGLIAAIGLVHVGAWRAGHVWGDDFALYILHARSLVQGRPYADTGYVYDPAYPQIGPPTYPPGLPLLLAPVYAAFGLNLTAMKGVMVVSFLLFLGMVYLCFRRDLSFAESAAVVALLGLNHFFFDDTNAVTSDLPFLALFYAALLLVRKAHALPPGSWQRAAGFLLAGLAIYLCYATRTLGALLVPAMLLGDLFSRRRITWPALMATALFALLALVQGLLLHNDRHYLDQLNVGPMVLVHNALGYASRVAAFWSNGYSKPAAAALCLAASVLALVGFVHRVRERVTVLESLTVIYLAVILAWPSYQGQRYLYPLAPLYLFYAVLGLRHAGWRGRLARPWQAAPDNAVLTRAGKPPVAPRAVAARGWVTAVLLLAVAASYLARYTTMDFRDLKQGVAKQESADLFEYIRTQTGKDDVIVFIKPRAMALFGQRRCSAYHVVADDRQLWDYFRRIDARYVVVVKDENTLKDFEFPEVVRFLGEFVRRNRSRFEWPPVYENADFAVYRIRPAVPHAQFGSKSNDTRGSHACTASMP